MIGIASFVIAVAFLAVLIWSHRDMERGNGKHRKSDQAASGGAADESSTGDTGAGAPAGPAASPGAINNAIQGSPASYYPQLQQAQLQYQYQQLLAQQNALFNVSGYGGGGVGPYLTPLVRPYSGTFFTGPGPSGVDAHYQPPKIEEAGIKMGEIIAWRVWRLDPTGYLSSMAVDSVKWAPGEPMDGDVRGNGVHAWKQKRGALGYADEYVRYEKSMNHADGRHLLTTRDTFVVGQIALWGEVIEHEIGYRAEFGKPISFDMLVPHGDTKALERIRELYLAPEPKV